MGAIDFCLSALSLEESALAKGHQITHSWIFSFKARSGFESRDEHFYRPAKEKMDLLFGEYPQEMRFINKIFCDKLLSRD